MVRTWSLLIGGLYSEVKHALMVWWNMEVVVFGDSVCYVEVMFNTGCTVCYIIIYTIM